ncbi:hypothetical protein [Pelagibacterium mangrovi]|uniref:hypothetical protein n=1 Tax=Pelagibacterium mangrovi TaxID=3119828 RepID=UPI002FC9978C
MQIESGRMGRSRRRLEFLATADQKRSGSRGKAAHKSAVMPSGHRAGLQRDPRLAIGVLHEGERAPLCDKPKRLLKNGRLGRYMDQNLACPPHGN